MEFADWLRDQLAKRPYLNQKRLAEALGINPSNVSFWLNGRSKPDFDKAGPLAQIFEVDRRVILQLMGVDSEPYEFKVIGPLVEEIDKLLASVKDDEERRIIEERLKADVRAARDMLEALDQLRQRRE